MTKPLITFDERSSQRIARAVQVVEGQKDVANGAWYPYRGSAKSHLVISKTTARWPIDSWATLAVWAGAPDNLQNTGKTFRAYNRFATIEIGAWVAVMGNELISARCGD